MGLFSRKPHIKLEVFGTEFFTNHILYPRIAGTDVSKVLVESVKQSISAQSPSFLSIDANQLGGEIVLLRFEMFALAILHCFGTEIAHHESQFTKEYLKSQKREDIWNDLILYNKMISKATVYEYDANTSAGKLARVKVDKMRMDEFDRWVNAGFDGESVARVVNRIASEKSWNNNITPQLLAWKLAERLNHEYDDNSLFGLSATIYGFYKGAKDEMGDIKIDI